MIQGQINRGSKLGETIYNMSRRPDVTNIVEIGTWNGMGSTKCIYDAIIGKTKKQVWSLECNKMRLEEAKVNLGFLMSNFRLIHGTIVDYNELAPIMETLENDTLKGWLKDDLNWLKVTPNVLNQLPDKIDLLIIDGGEFSGEKEFHKLWERSHLIILDDTNALKHKETKKFILSKPNALKVIEDNKIDRNGYLICENLNY